jgi:hypothetical protein
MLYAAKGGKAGLHYSTLRFNQDQCHRRAIGVNDPNGAGR